MQRERGRNMCPHCFKPAALCQLFRESEEALESTGPVADVFTTMPAQTTTTITSVAGLTSLLECPVCGDYAEPPILQCRNGHHLCTRCRQRVARCPICRAEKDTNRNLALDHLAEMNLFHCKYRSLGCSASLTIAAKQKHDMSCEYGPCSCVLGAEHCSWRGRPEKLVDHILGMHGFITRLEGESVCVTATSFDFVQNFTWYSIQTCHNRDFLVMLKKTSESPSCKHFFGVVLLVGSSKEARHFLYRLQFCGPDHRLTWEARMKGIHTLAESVQSGDGLIFIPSTARRLCNGGDLKMNVTISSTI